MSRAKGYQTKQKELILTCLRENAHRHMTVDMIMDSLRDQREAVGQTTVYRHLERLVKDNQLMRFAGVEGASACYQYLDQDENHKSHYHLVCSDCGRMIHVNCREMDELREHMLRDHRFILDSCKTVLYGRCDDCTQNQ